MNRLVENSDHLPVRIDRVRHEHKTVEIVGKALQDPRLTVARRPVENPGLAGEQRACNAISRLARKDQVLQDVLDAAAALLLLLRLHPADHLTVLVCGYGRRPGVALALQRLCHARMAALRQTVAIVPRV